uniref:S1 motif domain-containing protein n=2 Tax=Caenorhabditis tropicalis TaxID=1561998 RepID=A0A1I7TNC5_9PELO
MTTHGTLNTPWISFLFTFCFVVYLIFLGVTLFAPILTPQDSFGFYRSISGNILGNRTYEPEASAWDRCDLPKFDIWDDGVIEYINPLQNPIAKCNASLKPLTFLKDGKWGVTFKDSSISCRARCHSRKSERSNVIGEWMKAPGKVDCEVLEAVCSKNDLDFYGYLHTQVLPTPKRAPKVDTKNLDQYNVIVILLDSLSYSQARRYRIFANTIKDSFRSLPRTISYMTDHMDAVMFPYINKVGDNSRPNGAALYFGKLLEKLDKSLFEEADVAQDWSHSYMCSVFKDNETSLFSEFQDYGYKTLLSEDWAEGTLNWPNCKGFDKPPIDHNMRPFQNALERKNHGVNVTKYHLKGEYCREHHHTLLEYLSQFIKAYPDQKTFSWTWASMLGHNSENGFPHSDNDFYKFLLEKSFVFFMGDHGLRFGGVRKTFVGALDVNNPFLSISIPKNLRATTQILNMMRVNSQKIQTHFDTRATILDLLKVTELQQYNDKFKGSTLFTAKIVMEAPSSAVFEANVKMTETGEVKVLGVVERSNKYGDTADCIKSEEHRPFCFCKNQNVLKTTVKR